MLAPYRHLDSTDRRSLHSLIMWTQVLSGYHMERPKHCPRQIYKLMLKCWDLVS